MLSTGEKVIGDFQNIEGQSLKLKTPFLLKEVFSENGLQIVPLPLVQSSDEIIEINLNNVTVLPCNPVKELENAYIQLTSNIVIPKPGMNLVK
jgi:hypothetical protein